MIEAERDQWCQYQYFGIILGFVTLWATVKQRRSLVNTNSSVKIIMVEVQEEKQQSCNIDTTGVCEIMNLVTA